MVAEQEAPAALRDHIDGQAQRACRVGTSVDEVTQLNDKQGSITRFGERRGERPGFAVHVTDDTDAVESLIKVNRRYAMGVW